MSDYVALPRFAKPAQAVIAHIRKDLDSSKGEHAMSQQSPMNQCPSYQQPRKSFILRSWKLLPAVLLLALFLLVGPGNVHAATSTSAVKTHLSGYASCNYTQNYTLISTLRLFRKDGVTVDLQATSYGTVRIWHDGYYMNDYYLPYSDGSLYIYIGY